RPAPIRSACPTGDGLSFFARGELATAGACAANRSTRRTSSRLRAGASLGVFRTLRVFASLRFFPVSFFAAAEGPALSAFVSRNLRRELLSPPSPESVE